MNGIRSKLAVRYQRLKAFLGRNIPYVIVCGLISAMFVVFFWNRMVILIHPGELGVLWRCLGGGTQVDTVYREGMHLILPFNKMYIYNVRKQQFPDTIDVLTLDGLTVRVSYSTRYFLEKDTLPMLHQKVGPDYVNVLVKPEVRSVLRTVFGQYKPEEIYTSQRAIQERVSVMSKGHLEARFMALDDVPIESIVLPKKITEAIESKMAQEQLREEYSYRISVAEREAERRRIESGSIKNYNDTINQSLSASVLTWHGIKATEELSKSSNAKVVVIGAGKSGLPIILGKD
jgi:regulator of protease activity HflC (stomatin/prohibitin superfamily)